MDAIETLKQLIATQSFSREESDTADILQTVFETAGVPQERLLNNVWATHESDHNLPYILLCSHHDTVKPNSAYTRNPLEATIENGKLFGLGSNDAGGALVSLLQTFLTLKNEKLPYNLIFAGVAEEEISGSNGVTAILPKLPKIHLGIIGEPTEGKAAIAEKGLVVIDGMASGTPGHAAHHQGDHAILMAGRDIEKISKHEFAKVSPLLGPCKATVSQIQAGQQHNQVPASCEFVIDVRVNEMYRNDEVVVELQSLCESELIARSLRLQSSYLPSDHSFYHLLSSKNISMYGSPTLSDQALLPFHTVKIGPGKSERSHSADEFIFVEEIEKGIALYLDLLRNYKT